LVPFKATAIPSSPSARCWAPRAGVAPRGETEDATSWTDEPGLVDHISDQTDREAVVLLVARGGGLEPESMADFLASCGCSI
jgi:hypothetical protein